MKIKFKELNESIENEKKIANKIISLFDELSLAKDEKERRNTLSKINSLKKTLKETGEQTLDKIESIHLNRKLLPSILEIETLKRLKIESAKPQIKKGEKKRKVYIETANRIFSNFSEKLVDKKIFNTVKKDLVKTNFNILPQSYVSSILLSTSISIIISLIAFVFLLFFNISLNPPFISIVTKGFLIRVLELIWIPIITPILVFLFAFFYPSLEKRYLENKINQELPFATIHMSAIAVSMLDPSKIFSILSSTKEYPFLEKKFNALVNEINFYGSDLVSALRASAYNSPSHKLSDLFNGIATTITSGGNLTEFFEKRSQSLLFEYKIERERYIKSSETFMDVYISVVIAAPMILMLLLIMIKISGLGIDFSAQTMTLSIISIVALVNVLFLMFLQLKQPV